MLDAITQFIVEISNIIVNLTDKILEIYLAIINYFR